MAPKRNPLNLNPLQLKTLTLLQALAQLPEVSRAGEEPGSVVIGALPSPHGDHFHLGEAVVAVRDATGLRNPGVWAALVRKGLVRPGEALGTALVTALGLGYETGLAESILHRAPH